MKAPGIICLKVQDNETHALMRMCTHLRIRPPLFPPAGIQLLLPTDIAISANACARQVAGARDEGREPRREGAEL